MDRYNNIFARLLGKINGYEYYAFTLGQTTYYSCAKEIVFTDIRWMRHEEWHRRQFAQEGFFKFLIKYFYYMLKYGYYNNPYEVEARYHEEV